MRLEIPQPSEKQKLFFAERHKYVAFGGARGGGKSWAVRVKAVLLCEHYAGIKVMIVRKTYGELRANHIVPLCELLRCGTEEELAAYSESRKEIRFPNGSVILFRYCDTQRDAARFQGTEVDVLFVDEATQQSEEQMERLTACVRGVNAFPKRIYYTCNPGGQGHGYIKRIFLDRRYEAGEDPADYTFIQSLVTDNRALLEAQPDYIQQLEALPEKLRRAWLEGDWNVFEGQFFEDLRLTPDPNRCAEAGLEPAEAAKRGLWTHVIPAFEPPREWKLYRSFDWGYSRPFSCGWWAVDFDGRIYRILELYGCTKTPNEGVKWTPDRVFAEIRRLETEHPWLRGRQIEGVADPAIWDGSGGESIAETAERHRVWFSPGDHQRIPGWMQCHYRLQFDETGVPMMYVFDTCRAFLRTVPTMVYDPNRPEDLDTSQEDHVADEWRYFCMARPIRPIIREEQQRIWTNPLAD